MATVRGVKPVPARPAVGGLLVGLLAGAVAYGVGAAGADAPRTDPACAEVWVEGRTLPADYDGCLDVDGTRSGAPYRECADGARFVSWQGSWAVTGGPVVSAGTGAAAADPAHGDVLAACPG